MVRALKPAFFVVGKQRGKRVFLRKRFQTREDAEKEIRKARMRAALRAQKTRASGGRLERPRLTGVRIIKRPKFGFRKRKR